MKNRKIYIIKILFFISLINITCSKNDENNNQGPGAKVTGVYVLLLEKSSNIESHTFQFVSKVEITKSDDSENKFLLYRLETFMHDSLGAVNANINNSLEISISEQTTLASGSPSITGSGQITDNSIYIEYTLSYSSDLIESYSGTGTKQ